MAFRLTAEAERQLKIYMEEQGGDLLPRVYIQSGGCSGLKYMISLDNRNSDDAEILSESGLVVLVSPDSLDLLDGVILDYKRSLMSEGFIFENPNAYSCGCGSSFRPKDAEECI